TVMDANREAGCIVFENKNTKGWKSREYLAQAKRYRLQYETPFVAIVHHTGPKTKSDRNAYKKDHIPVVKLSEVVSLLSALRAGILAIARLNLAKVGTDQKAKGLLKYVSSEEYQQRASDMDTALNGLKHLQQAEKTSHERHWKTEWMQF